MRWMPLAGVIGAAAVIIGTGALAVGLHLHAHDLQGSPPRLPALEVPSGTPAIPALIESASVQEPIVCWVSGSQSRFEPCGCVAGMRGGLLRRAALVARMPSKQLLQVELGGWSAGPGGAQALRMEAYLSAAAQAGVQCVVVGEDEIALGAPALSRLLHVGAAAGLHMLCANLVAGSQPWPLESSCTLQVAGHPLLVTAVTRADATGDGLTTSDPAAAARAVMTQSPGLPLVILADLDEDGLHALARAVPGAYLVVGGRVTTPTAVVSHEGAVRIIHVANHGKTVGWWPWDSERCAFELLDEQVPDQAVIALALSAHERALALSDLPEDHRGPALGLLGSTECLQCHADAGKVHAASGHAHSLAALVRRGYDHDPECLVCHVTGLGSDDGFSRLHPTAKPGLGAVSCETCHGPGEAHVSAMREGTPGAGPMLMATAATCVRCHDSENSPTFTYAAYWPRIAHGLDVPEHGIRP